jgi:epoxyqueuosine reductase
MNLITALKTKTNDLGFDLVAIAPVGPSPDHERYVRWLETGYAGEMDYLARHTDMKTDPRRLLPEAKSVVLVGLNYAQPPEPALRSDPSRGQIAVYALGDDYHKIMRKALIELDGWLRTKVGRSTQGRVFVDSAPVLERSWARRAGLGFIGKNTCLINPDIGSWFFLGGLLVPEVLDYDEAPKEQGAGGREQGVGQQSTVNNQQSTINEKRNRPSVARNYAIRNTGYQIANTEFPLCGSCTRCLDVCPTGALVSPYELDARRCISYLTIELRGEMPVEFRPHVGNWVFGCDLCQDVCPWNRKALSTTHPRLQPHPDRLAPPLLDLLNLDQDAFARRFRGSAVKRAKWEGFMRNVCVAAGNWGDPATLPGLEHHLFESPPLVAGHAAWALGRLRDDAGRSILQRAWEQLNDVSVRTSVVQALK